MHLASARRGTLELTQRSPPPHPPPPPPLSSPLPSPRPPAASRAAEVSCWMHTGERQAACIRERYVAAILAQEMAFFDACSAHSSSGSSGQIVSDVSSNVLLVQDAISEKVGNFLHFMATFIAAFIIGFTTLWQLTLVVLAIVPLMAGCGAVYAVAITGVTSKGQQAYAKAGAVAEQAVGQVRSVYSFVAEEKTLMQYRGALERTVRLGLQGGLFKGMGLGGMCLVMFCAWALQFWFAAKLVAAGKATGGQALTTMFSALIGGMSLGQAMPNLTAFAKGQAAAHTIFHTIHRKPAMHIGDTSGEAPAAGDVKGNLELHSVRFSYPARPDVAVFEDFSLEMAAGTTVAIVGPSGSGKSTVVALVERFYDPIAGAVYLDGRDIRSLQLKWLREQIGLVSQEPALFATSIKENIMYGKDGATMEEVEAAAKVANAHEFISGLPEGYGTQVGERGLQMSGGQKQRIAIARAILRNPAILLLDEATSALDAEAEKAVQRALDGVMKGRRRTTVVIAHRLSTIRGADSIAVVGRGRVVEQGTHDALMAKEGEYAALVKLQLQAVQAVVTPEDAMHGGEEHLSCRWSIDLQQSSLSDGGRSAVDSHGDEKESGEAKRSGTWWRLFKLTLTDWPHTALAVVAAAIAGALNAAFGLFLTIMVTAYYKPVDQMQSQVNTWAVIFLCMGVLTLLVYTLQHYNFAVVSERLTARVRDLMLASILRNEVAWFDHGSNSSGAIAARLAADAALVQGAIGGRISAIAQNASLVAVAFAISFALNWRMALVVLATFPLVILSAAAQQAFFKGFAGDLKAAHESASSVAAEAVGNIRTVAALSLEAKVLGRFRKELEPPLKRSLQRGQVAGLAFGGSQFCMYVSFAVGLWYGGQLVEQKVGTFEDVFKVFMVLTWSSFAIAETLTLAPDLAKGGYAIKSLFSVLDRQTKIVPDYPTAEMVESVQGEIALKQDPLAGAVLVDGKDVRSLHLRSLRSFIGLVGERGTQLSGGQKQRIAIARAVLKNPAILLLDEATSALDAESERVVQDALDRLMVGRTTVVIAHRLSTIHNADLIAVVQSGKIVEKGTHNELFSNPTSVYHSLVKLQQSSRDTGL
ncbi:unnamed protein product [Closterium sp. Yama58-4]|nr:unnamed protein product [Closterium sp. Yama58-4]